MDNPERVTYFAATDSRGQRVPFGIKEKDRNKHMYVIGKTGMGKSTLLENMAIQDIRNGEGLAFMDPHGGTADKLLEYIPPERLKDVVYFAPFDLDQPIAFNIMEDVGYDKRHLVVSGLMATFKKIWEDAWSARMEYILTNTLLALLEYPDATLLGVNRMYTDKGYRKKVVDNIKDPIVKEFWTKEFAGYTDKFTAEATPAIQNKIGQFTGNPLIRNIIGQPKSSFDIRELMDQKKILIINLSKGQVGETNMMLLGSMITTRIFLAAMSRADLSGTEIQKLPNFFFYVDEFQNFANETFAGILSEARKYKLNLTIAHQYVEQMEEEVAAAVFGNVGTVISFRVGPFDAEKLEVVFAPEFTPEDLVNLGPRQIYLSLMIDGAGSRPFSASTIPPIEPPARTYKAEAIETSRAQFGNSRAGVEEYIASEISSMSDPLPEPSARPRSPYAQQGGADRARSDAPRAPMRTNNYAPSAPRERIMDAPPRTHAPDAPMRERVPESAPRPARENHTNDGGARRSEPRPHAERTPRQEQSREPVPAREGNRPSAPTASKSGEELRAILRGMSGPKEKPKGPNPEPLKNALRDVLSKEVPAPEPAPQAPERQERTQLRPEQTSTQEHPKKKPYEVPEEDLKAIFKEPL